MVAIRNGRYHGSGNKTTRFDDPSDHDHELGYAQKTRRPGADRDGDDSDDRETRDDQNRSADEYY